MSHSAPESAPHSSYYAEIAGQPDLLKVVDILEWTLRAYGRVGPHSLSQLTRVHFHCLLYHIIAVVEPLDESIDGVDVRRWTNNEAGLLSGSKIAAKQACGLDYNDESSENELHKLLELRMLTALHHGETSQTINFKIDTNVFERFEPSKPVLTFRRDRIRFYFTPVLVCKRPLKTVGLGDAISSNGLLYSSLTTSSVS
jgi:ADP-dependent glucokinase